MSKTDLMFVTVEPLETKGSQFSDETLEAIAEAEEIMKNPDAYPSYNSVEELLKALKDE